MEKVPVFSTSAMKISCGEARVSRVPALEPHLSGKRESARENPQACLSRLEMLHDPVRDAEDGAHDDPALQPSDDGEDQDRRVHAECELVDEPEERAVHDDCCKEREEEVERQREERQQRPYEKIQQHEETSDDDARGSSAEDGDVLGHPLVQRVHQKNIEESPDDQLERGGGGTLRGHGQWTSC